MTKDVPIILVAATDEGKTKYKESTTFIKIVSSSVNRDLFGATSLFYELFTYRDSLPLIFTHINWLV